MGFNLRRGTAGTFLHTERHKELRRCWWGSERNETEACLSVLMKKRGGAFIPLSYLLSVQLARENKPFIYLFSSPGC